MPNLLALTSPLIYYNFNLDYNIGNISINSMEIDFYNKAMENNFGEYSLNVIDIKGNNEKLYGKIVYFNLRIEEILEKINNIKNIQNKGKYTIEKIETYNLNNSVEILRN